MLLFAECGGIMWKSFERRTIPQRGNRDKASFDTGGYSHSPKGGMLYVEEAHIPGFALLSSSRTRVRTTYHKSALAARIALRTARFFFWRIRSG
jgi:hypothetical protein